MTFDSLGLRSDILKGIEELGFTEPTPIQEKIVPILIDESQDVVALAQTGTGKTAAFGLPMLHHVELNDYQVQTLILSPTRELGMQIAKDIKDFTKHVKGVRTLCVYGGSSIDTQIKALKKGINILVATPGRLQDLIKRKRCDLSNVKIVVLDEADEMLNMGFKDELDFILDQTNDERKTWLFSATMPPEVARIAKNYMSSPLEVTVGSKNEGAKNIDHHYYHVRPADKYEALKRVVDFYPDIFGLVFCNTKRDTQDIADKLMAEGYSADALHGDLSQYQRDRVMAKFRERQIQILCATDVAARGIDVSDITHVINYGVPEDVEAYTHRSGRTARAGKSGVSIAIVTQRDLFKIKRIEKIIKRKFESKQVPAADQILESQLKTKVKEVKDSDILADDIEKYKEIIYPEFADLSKEEILDLFISREFGQLFEYYRKSRDINAKAGDRGSRGRDREDFGRGRDRGGRRERGDRSSRGDRDRSSRRGERAERGGDRSERGERRRAVDPKFQTIYLNVGTKEDLNKGSFIDLICQNCNIKGRAIGQIRMNETFTFFEVEKVLSDKVFDGLQNSEINGRKVRVELAK